MITPLDAKIPLVLGITGHRDIRIGDERFLKSAIAQIIEDLGARHRSTPMILLSALAEGADRLATEVAIEKGLEVIAVLPMAASEYEHDFSTPESIATFRTLLDKVHTQIEIPQPHDGTHAGHMLSLDQMRDRRCQHAGMYVALHCHILIALWDGLDDCKVGGTAEVVEYQEKGLPSPCSELPPFCRRDSTALDLPETGPVIHILTPHGGEGTPIALGTPLSICRRPPAREGHTDEYFNTIFERLDAYNKDIEQALSHADFQRSANDLMPTDAIANYRSLASLCYRFAGADALALSFRDPVRYALYILTATVSLAPVCLALFAHTRELPVWLAMYLVMFFLAWLIYLSYVKPRDLQGRFQDYRVLAEALRVQFFWRLSGLPCNVSDYYLRSQSDQLAWIRQAARICSIAAPMQPSVENLSVVRRYWIEKEARYFSETAERECGVFDRLHKGRAAFYQLHFSVAGLLLFFLFLDENFADTHQSVVKICIIFMAIAPAIGALIGFVLERRGFESHIRQFRLMADLYMRANAALSKTVADIPSQQDILVAIGREALAENADWVILHRERLIEPPQA